MPSLTVQDYYVGWICALNIELTAATAMLDEEHEMIAGQDPQDQNSYVLGRIHQHNVVIACIPEGVDGLVPAANVAKDMARTFPGLRIGLMVGIGSGVPALSKGIDIRLGDIVVSKPEKTWGGVVQYDKGKGETGGKFVVKGLLNQPPALLLHTLAQLRARHAMRPSKVPDYIKEAIGRNPIMEESGFILPTEPDCLYCSVCDKDIENPAADCEGFHAKRKQRKNNNPMVHYGVIASANQVVKDAAVRDRLRDEFDALCVEMEAAGLMNEFPSLVIRGICDYADVHKNDAWHAYAAMTAAAYAKEFLQYISLAQTMLAKPIQDIVAPLDEHLWEVRLKHEQRYQNDQHSRCYRAFKTSAYEQFKDINPDRVAGTCQWALSHSQYRQWLTKAHDDLLWISTGPGCGKSVLAKSLVDHELQNTDQHTVCHFFFKDNDEQDNVATALCALLHQLFSRQPELIQYAIPVWEKTGDKLMKEVPELWRILLAAAKDDQAHDVTCVLDALDECQLPDQRWLIKMLSGFYAQTSVSSSTTRRGRLKFLVTSRPYDDIQAEFQKRLHDLPTIRLRGEEENDQIQQEINLVTRIRVGQLATDLKLGDDIKDQLETKLLEIEHRTYLWLYLAIESIYQTYRNNLRPKEASIKSLPTSVEDAYEKILSRVDQEQRGNVKKILQIVIGARRPLHIEEMAIALGIAVSTQLTSLHKAKLDPNRLENSIRHWCGLFVFINHARIYLIHQTAKEFLVGESGCATFPAGWKNCLDAQGIEREMTQICVEFLSFDNVGATAQSLIQQFRRYKTPDEFLEKDDHIQSLLVYSAEHWPSHLREAYLPNDDSAVLRILRFYQVNSRLYNVWFPIFWQATRPYAELPEMSPIRLGGLLGHENILELTLQRKEDYDINESDREGRTSLIWASEYGHEKVVQLLLDRGADVNAQGGQYGNALQAASYNGHEKVVRILLNMGADVNAQGGYYGNALQAASARGHEKVVQLLLNIGADINAQGGYYGNALQAASARGHEKVVQLLLDRGADVNAQGGQYGNALQAASYNGHEKVVQLLLNIGADVNAQGGYYGNTLQAASERGHEKVVQLLLNIGADVNAQGGYYGNALQAASERGHEKVVQLLLNMGADVNTQGGYYGNALQAASERGHEKVVQLLLNIGADVNAQGGYYGNTLQAASERGHEKVVQLLLDRGADVNAQGGQYGNALQAASARGHEKVVQLLLDRGADVNAQGGQYGNTLQAASARGHEKVVQLLLNMGADVNAQGGYYGNALQAASASGHEKVVQLLLNMGADVNAQGGYYGNALQAASASGHEKMVKILLNQGPDVNSRGGYHDNALQAASSSGHVEVVKILLDEEALLGNSLEAAARVGHGNIVELLLQHATNVKLDKDVYNNARAAATAGDHQAVLRCLFYWRRHVLLSSTSLKGGSLSSLASAVSGESFWSTSSASTASSIPAPSSTRSSQVPDEVYTLLFEEVLSHSALEEPLSCLHKAREEAEFLKTLARCIKVFCMQLVAEKLDEVQAQAGLFLRQWRHYFAYRKWTQLNSSTSAASLTSKYSEDKGQNVRETVERYLESQHGSMSVDIHSPGKVDQILDPHITHDPETLTPGELDGDEQLQKGFHKLDISNFATAEEDGSSDEDSVTSQEPSLEFLLTDRTIARLIESTAFKNLRLDILRETTLPLQYVEMVLGSVISQGPTQEIKLHLEWDILNFLEKELDDVEQLPTVLILNGGIDDAEAVTSGEYCQRHWPVDGLTLLKFVQNSVTKTTNGYRLPSGTEVSVQFDKWDQATYRYSEVSIRGQGSDVILVCQQLAWFSVAFRSPSSEKLSTSEFTLRPSKNSSKLELKLLKLRPFPAGSDSCWHPLFPTGILAYGFPIRGRNSESGLELPFRAMTQLAGINDAVFYQAGLVLKGFSTIIYAVRRSHALSSFHPDSAQWHLIKVKDRTHANLLLLRDEKDVWLCSNSQLESLIDARTFLGGYQKVSVHLATESDTYTRLLHPSIEPLRRKPELQGFSLSMGLPKFGGPSVSGNFTLQKAHKQKTKLEGYTEVLNFTRRLPVILYDTSDRRGWMVPAVSVIFHMVHIWRARNQSTHPTPIAIPPFAAAVSDIGEEAQKKLYLNCHFELYTETMTNSPYCLSDLVLRYWGIFEQIIADDQPSKPTSRNLQGWDMVDMVDKYPSIQVSKAHVKDFRGNWNGFALDNNTIVLLGNNFGDIITPELGQQQICQQWKSVPKQHDYLTVTSHCLKSCFDKYPNDLNSMRLTHAVYWQPAGDNNPFADCSHAEGFSCNRAQKLGKARRWNRSFPFEPEGAVIFGENYTGPKKNSLRIPQRESNTILPMTNETTARTQSTEFARFQTSAIFQPNIQGGRLAEELRTVQLQQGTSQILGAVSTNQKPEDPRLES